MEKMPYTADMDREMMRLSDLVVPASVITSDWRTGLPVLTGRSATLRELQLPDATSLLAMLTAEEVSRFISPPPTTVEGFERFILWANRERAAGNYACFAIEPQGTDTAVGLFQLRQLEPGWGTGEWGFALGSPYWGSGLFAEGAELVLRFTFETVGVHRLEARAALHNGRGTGALRKIGAVQEGVLRRSFLRNGQYHDQGLYSILAEEWLATHDTDFLPIH